MMMPNLLPFLAVSRIFVVIFFGMVVSMIDVVYNHPLKLLRVIHTKPFRDSYERLRDTEALAYIPATDALWIADDNSNSIVAIERSSGRFLRKLTKADFAAACEPTLNNGVQPHAYFDELETLAYDRGTGALYVINTVSRPENDRPAIFKVTGRNAPRLSAWQPLPSGVAYNAAVVIDGQMLIADSCQILTYDFETNGFSEKPKISHVQSAITGLAYDGRFLWVLNANKELIKLVWETGKETGRYDLGAFGISRPVGLEIVDGRIYLTDGDHPNPIYVFEERFTQT